MELKSERIFRYVTQSEKRAILPHFIVLHNTHKHEKIDINTKKMFLHHDNLYSLSYRLIYYLPGIGRPIESYSLFYKVNSLNR